MTAYDDLDRALAAWFESDSLPGAPAGRLESTIAATRLIRPRPAWLGGVGSRWPGSPAPIGRGAERSRSRRADLRLSMMFLLVLVLIALVGGALLVGARFLTPPTSGDGRLAYSLDGDVFVADWDGGHPVRVADGAPDRANSCESYWAEGPMWAPDGRHIAYRGGGIDCDEQVFIADADGRVVSSFRSDGWLVSWSPDSTRVATWATLGRTIAIDGIDGVRQAEIDLPDGKAPTGDYDPVWSPDGRSVLIRLGPPSPSRIWEIPVDGRTARQVPDADARSEANASWSKDARRVAYIPVLRPYSLVVANADGTPIRVLEGALAGNDGYGPGNGPHYGGAVLSPAGDRAAFNVTPPGPLFLPFGRNAALRYELGVVDVASGAMTTLYKPDGFDIVDPIEFSADGKRLLFRRSNDTTASFWSVDVDGSNARQLIANAEDADWR